MKKILAMILAMLLVLSMTVAFAEDPTYTDVSSITITKTYKAANGGVSPAEDFEFENIEFVSATDTGVGYTETWAKANLPEIGKASFTEGEATATGADETATITLPSNYPSVGVYTYSFTEKDNKTAGVTYNTGTFYLVVTVVEDGGKKRIAAVHCEGSHDAGTYGKDPKTDKFVNTYESGTLAVSKKVTGNLGDKSKYFDVTVTFAPASGETINSTIKYTGGSGDYVVTADAPATVSNNTVTLHLKDGDTFNFTNIPEGVTWKVEEADYTTEAAGKYDAASYTKQTDTMTAGGEASCEITNNKDITIDTGVILQYAPYIAILAVVLAGAILLIIRRRRNNED